MIKAILIDIDNTLLDFEESSKMSIKESFFQSNLPYTEKTYPTFKKINDGLWQKIEKKEITLAELHRDRWNIIFESLGIKFNGQVMEQRFLTNLNHSAVLIEGAREILEYLSKKYMLCSASNAPENQQIARLKYSNIKQYITHQFISSRIGYNKPDERFFNYCFNIISPIEKEEVVLVGDSLTADILGGINYGIKTIWFNKDNKENDTIIKPDFIVNKLLELKNIL